MIERGSSPSSARRIRSLPSWVENSISPFAIDTPPNPPDSRFGAPLDLPGGGIDGEHGGLGRDGDAPPASEPRCCRPRRSRRRRRRRLLDAAEGGAGHEWTDPHHLSGLRSKGRSCRPCRPPRRASCRRPRTGSVPRRCRSRDRVGGQRLVVVLRVLLGPDDSPSSSRWRSASPTSVRRCVRLPGSDERHLRLLIDRGRRPHRQAGTGAGAHLRPPRSLPVFASRPTTLPLEGRAAFHEHLVGGTADDDEVVPRPPATTRCDRTASTRCPCPTASSRSCDQRRTPCPCRRRCTPSRR